MLPSSPDSHGKNPMTPAEPAGPPGIPILGNYLALQRDPLGFFVRNAREFGHIYPFKVIAHRPWYHVSHPDFVEHVLRNVPRYPKDRFGALISLVVGEGLLSMDGDGWAQRRRTVQPAFHRQRIAGFVQAMRDGASSLLSRWDALPAHARRVEPAMEFSRLTLTIVGRALLGVDLQERASGLIDAFESTLEELNYRLVHPFALPAAVPTPRNLRYRSVVRAITANITSVIHEARAGAWPDSVLSMLIEARDEQGRSLSDSEVAGEIRTMVAAGHETTASALFWVFALLARHPECERRVQAEADALSDVPTLEDLPRLTYTRAVIDEAMRLYPSVMWQGRVAREDDELGGCRISAGTPIVLGFYVMHRHPDFWDRPDQFDPDRFDRARPASGSRAAYVPFGAGPRQCIGTQFALIEMQIAVAAIARRYRLRLESDAPIVPQVLATLRPPRGVMVQLEPRS